MSDDVRLRDVQEPGLDVFWSRSAGHVVAWWERRQRFIGYWLGRRYWGRGIGTTALTLFLRQELARPLHADPVVGNAGSVRLLEKFGFRRTGTVRHGEREHVVLVLRGDT